MYGYFGCQSLTVTTTLVVFAVESHEALTQSIPMSAEVFVSTNPRQGASGYFVSGSTAHSVRTRRGGDDCSLSTGPVSVCQLANASFDLHSNTQKGL